MSNLLIVYVLLIVAVTTVVVVTAAEQRQQLVPAQKHDLQQFLRTSTASNNHHDVTRSLNENYLNNFAVDGLETSYDEYSQAWRMLGMYIDCGDDNDNDEIYNNNNNNNANAAAGRRRRHQRQRRADQVDNDNNEVEGNEGAEGAEGGEGAEGEGEAQEGENNDQQQQDAAEQNNNNADQKKCKRYLLWAAYVDLNYEGNGINEYQIYNPHAGKWNKTLCNGGGRCARMDCHLPNSHFKLLGFFKEEYPLVFLKSLATHQGSCTWKNGHGDASVMNTVLSWFPSGCVQSKTSIEEGSAYTFYMDIQPTYAGSVNVGLYTDVDCINPYTYPQDSVHTITSVLNTYYGYETDADTTLQSFNSMLNDFKVCQPCHTYDMSNVADVDGDSDADYVCIDSAGNNGINMCSAFATQTSISKATFHDVEKASSQTTIVRTYTKSDIVASWWDRWGFLLLSAIIFVIGSVCFCSVAVKRKRTVVTKRKLLSVSSLQDKKEPLINM